MRIPVVGQTYESRSVAVDAQRTINWYPERVESGTGKNSMVLYPTPGLKLFGTLPDTPVRGLFSELGRVWAVAGSHLYEVMADGTSVERGTVLNSIGRVSMRSNGLQGHQLFVVSGGNGYILDTTSNVFTALTTVPGFPSGQAVTGTFLDGYFIVSTATSFQVSGLFNGLEWDGSMKAIRSMGADGIVCAFQSHRELWIWGPVTTEVWYDSGGTFPFTPIQGVFIEMGCHAPHSPQLFDNGVVWLSANRDGDRIAVMSHQYVPQRISTHACEMAWRRYTKADDAVAFCYQDDGHSFYVLSFPSAQATWVYDAATKMWHERAYWNITPSRFEAHRAVCHCRAFGKHIVGDRENGKLYSLDLRHALDDTEWIRRARRTPHISSENRRLFYSRLELEMETGLPLMPPDPTQTTAPQVMLRWSDDRGHTWSPEQWRGAGTTGQYMARVQWDRLGSSRDRVFEVTMSAQVPWRLIDGYLTVQEGMR